MRRVAQGGEAEPRRRRFTRGAALGVGAPGERPRDARVDAPGPRSGRGSATGVTASDRQSSSNAWSATPNSEQSWSMIPPGTPVASTSPRSAVCATSRRSSQSKSAASASASVSPMESAELDESPEPAGTDEVTVPSKPIGSRPSSASARTTPATYRPHRGSTPARVVTPVGGDVDGAGDLARSGP